jgi:hypothetical protein
LNVYIYIIDVLVTTYFYGSYFFPKITHLNQGIQTQFYIFYEHLYFRTEKRSGAVVARWAHNSEVPGSIPGSANIFLYKIRIYVILNFCVPQRISKELLKTAFFLFKIISKMDFITTLPPEPTLITTTTADESS